MSLTFEYALPILRHRPQKRPPPVVKPVSRRFSPDKVARLLALGHLVQDMVERGDLRDFKEAAIRLHKAESRISQIVSLTRLAPDIQERVLLGTLKIAEIHIRKALDSADWDEQRAFIARKET